MRVEKVNEREYNVVVEGKGHFNVIMDDWGGEYPGVDVCFIPEGKLEGEISTPRVMFELGYDSENPVVRVWEDPNNEDHTYEHTFDLGQYNEEEQVC